MYTKGLSIPLLLFLFLNSAMAGEVSVWLPEISDGGTKDREYGAWDDDTHYDVHQDEAFTLLKRSAPIRLGNRPIGHEWRIILTPTKQRQVIKGLGAAMTDSSAFVPHQLKQHNPELYEFTMQRLFSRDHGAGFSYLRRPIGSSDYTATKSSYT